MGVDQSSPQYQVWKAKKELEKMATESQQKAIEMAAVVPKNKDGAELVKDQWLDLRVRVTGWEAPQAEGDPGRAHLAIPSSVGTTEMTVYASSLSDATGQLEAQNAVVEMLKDQIAALSEAKAEPKVKKGAPKEPAE